MLLGNASGWGLAGVPEPNPNSASTTTMAHLLFAPEGVIGTKKVDELASTSARVDGTAAGLTGGTGRTSRAIEL
jgi:hypothetical protein